MIAMRGWMRLVLLAVVAVVFCTPLFVGLGRTDQENDEAIYSYAAESLLETGDWLNPRSSPSPHAVFLEKPPLKFWIVALPIRLGLLPDNDFGLRFWDAVFGSLAFLYVFSIGRRMAGWLCGAVALLILYSFSSLIFVHGLRGNNMEAALVLAYAGAIYHFLRWAEERDSRAAWRHALAVGLYFLLGFMTKFVAVLFLPAILAGAALELTAVRDKAQREWRRWGLVAVVVVGLAAPWFIYQARLPFSRLWQVMLGEHVYQRFNVYLDPTHLKPWYYYFTDLSGQMGTAGTWLVVLAGGVLIHARVLRERWLEGTVGLYWFWLPFVLMSVGTSKLRHYAYPFLPAVALAGGYLIASVANLAGAVADGRPPAWVSRIVTTLGVDRVVARGRAATGTISAHWSSHGRDVMRAARALLVGAALCYLALAAVALVYPSRVTLAGFVIVRDPSVLRPALIAVALGALGGRGRWAVRVGVVLTLLSVLPVASYLDTLARVQSGSHPLQSARGCLQSVVAAERGAGRTPQRMYVYLPKGFFQHPYYFYFRRFGWDNRDELSDVDLMRMLDAPAEQRPILMPREQFIAVLAAHEGPRASRPLVSLGTVVLLLPGPYAKCGM
jgi:4-amino-4-deoxy-L-arabinose transferase-like glycosyltransferase